MKVKVSEASGAVLDWMVAKCEGIAVHWDSDEDAFIFFDREEGGERSFTPSTDWSQAGPIIEREKISVVITNAMGWKASVPYSFDKDMEMYEFGPTPLIAAMRCYCVSKLGDEVEVPDELA